MKMGKANDNNSTTEEMTTEIAIVDEATIRNKIYEIRGIKVMLDFDLAEIYGYETKSFNQQVRRNEDRFPEDFRFKLTREEVDNFVRSQNVTSQNVFQGQSGGTRYLPWAFSESGVYMLMTVLGGELAKKQSIALIRIFRAMKDYITENQGLVTRRDMLRLSMQTNENTEAIRQIQTSLDEQQKTVADQQKLLMEHDDKLAQALEQIGETVKKSDIAPILELFDQPEDQQEILLREGQPVKADITYMDIYSKATKSIYIIDNYISIKTLNLLQGTQSGVAVTVFSDNIGNRLHSSDYSDFQVEFPSIPITFITTGGIIHDRFIVLDYEEPNEQIYHCGASSKDAGVKRVTAITEFKLDDVKAGMHMLIDQMKGNPILVLS